MQYQSKGGLEGQEKWCARQLATVIQTCTFFLPPRLVLSRLFNRDGRDLLGAC